MNSPASIPSTQAGAACEIVPVLTPQDLDIFIRLPWSLYAGDPNWVPPLVASERKLLDRRKNPFWHQSRYQAFLARREGRLVGRIAAIVNAAHNETHGEKTGFWGYFECENHSDTAKALFAAAERWLKEQGMERSRGPANPSMNDTCGLLVDGFKWSPFVMMTYNPSYYLSLVEGAGYTKGMDLWAYILPATELVKDKVEKVAHEVKQRGDIAIRFIDLSRFEEELRLVMDIYNDAWSKNWGFVQMTQEELRFAAKEMKSVILPEYVYIAEMKGEPVGFALALPDINHMLKKCNGSLFPFGWFYFLKFNLRKIPTFRIIALGAKQKYQHMGIGTLFYMKYIEEGLKRGIKAGEFSWILETNTQMNRPLQQMGAKPYKTYRMYEKSLHSYTSTVERPIT